MKTMINKTFTGLDGVVDFEYDEATNTLDITMFDDDYSILGCIQHIDGKLIKDYIKNIFNLVET